MSHPLVIANWKMNIPSGGISGWIPEEMVSTNCLLYTSDAADE